MANKENLDLENFCTIHWDKGEVTIERCANCTLNTEFSKRCKKYLNRRKNNG